MTNQQKEKVEKMKDLEKVLITIQEASEYLGIGKEAVRKMTAHEDCPIIFMGRHRRLIKPLLLDFLKDHMREDFGQA